MTLAFRNGWWWPADDQAAQFVIMRDKDHDIAALLAHVPGREVIVQAGANVGVYPVELAKQFRRVYTAEPDPTNWACLQKNLEGREEQARIMALQAAFGEARGGCQSVEVQRANCGAHRVRFDQGDTPVWPIDDLELEACDCIWLDVEGSELLALKGAARTIERFSPTISVEAKGLHGAFGIRAGELQDWLKARGYHEVARYGRDKVFRRTA